MGAPELVQGPAFNLPNTFPGQLHHLADLTKGLRLIIDQTEPELENPLFSFGEFGKRIAKLRA